MSLKPVSNLIIRLETVVNIAARRDIFIISVGIPVYIF